VLIPVCWAVNTVYNVENSTTADIECGIYNSEKPGWSGPPLVNGLPTTYAYYAQEAYNTFNDRLSWAENRRILRLFPVVRNDTGVYACNRPGSDSWQVQLRVRGMQINSYVYLNILQLI